MPAYGEAINIVDCLSRGHKHCRLCVKTHQRVPEKANVEINNPTGRCSFISWFRSVQFNCTTPPPPGGVPCWVVYKPKIHSVMTPPGGQTPKSINFRVCSSGGVLFLRVLGISLGGCSFGWVFFLQVFGHVWKSLTKEHPPGGEVALRSNSFAFYSQCHWVLQARAFKTIP